jgi:hypothetical protein
MSDLRHFPTNSPDVVRQQFAEFLDHCDLILAHVFDRGSRMRQEFRRWMEERITTEENSILILHDEPLYSVAKYVGASLDYVHSPAIEKKYFELARRSGWLPP